MKKQIKEIIKNLSPEEKELLLSEISKSVTNNFKSAAKNEYEEIFNSINDCVFIHDAETGEILDVNSKTCEVFGYSKNELLKLTVEQLSTGFPPFTQKEALEKAEIAKGGKDQLFEWQSRKKNGEIFFSEVNMHYINTGAPKIVATIRDITERKKTEGIIIAHETFLNNLLNTLPIPVFYKDKEGRYIDANNAFITFFGSTREQIIGKTVYDLYPVEQAKIYCEKDKELFEQGGTQIYETVVINATGNEHKVIIHKATFNDSQQKTAGLIGAILDITELKLAEEANIAGKERWESLFDNSPNSIAIYKAVDAGMDFEITDYNLKAQKMTYLNRDEVVGKRITDLFPRVEENALLPVLRRVWQTGKTEYIKSNYVKESLVEGWLENTIYKLKTGEIVGIYKDVTDYVNAEKALQISEEKFRSLFENHVAVKLLIDPETGNIIDANYAASNYYGWSLDELKQMKIQQINILSEEKVIDEMEKVKDRRRDYFEFKHTLKNGSIRDVEVYSSKIEIAGKAFIHSIIHDITEKKKTELELQKYREHLEELVETRTEELDRLNSDLIAQLQKEKELELMLKLSLAKEKEVNELKSRFISTASHEFRTPLTTVLTSSGLIERYSKKGVPEKIDEHVKKIIRSVDYVVNLLDEVLTIGRIESGKTEFRPEAVNLDEFCREIITEVKPIVKKGIKLIYNYSSNLLTFNVDVRLLKSVLLNLLTNAIKYSSETGKVELKVWTEEGDLFLEVTDEGIGIPDEEKKHLCEPFYRCKNVSDIAGTGLGLSIVKQSVELHGGELFINSKMGEGSTFKIKLPA